MTDFIHRIHRHQMRPEERILWWQIVGLLLLAGPFAYGLIILVRMAAR